MIECKKLFKTYNLKTWKHNKLQIFFSITAISIAVAILISLRLILVINNFYTIDNPKSVNDGDINIALSNYNISSVQLKVLDELTSEDKIKYACTYKIQNNLTIGGISNVVNIKFIDSKYSYINKRIGRYSKKLGKDKVLINRAAADRFDLKKGDKISLALKDFSDGYKKFAVEDIIEGTNTLEESILGVIILDKSNMEVDKSTKNENVATNINIVINNEKNLEEIKSELKKAFDSGASINTYKKINQGNKNIYSLQNKAAGIIEILVVIVTGIGISVTALLLILKRKKDYIILSIYGMKEKMLRNLIIYETFIICIIGIFIGTFFSFIITGCIQKSVIKEMDIITLIKVSAFPLVSTILFIIVQTMIFTILPITIGKEIKPNSILRQETQKFSVNGEWSAAIFTIIVLMVAAFSIYIGSIKTGLIHSCIMLVIIMILYLLSIAGISLIVKIKPAKNKFLLLALRNIHRQKRSFALCITSLISTLILCGLIINLSTSVFTTATKEVVIDTGYNLSLSTGFNKENVSNTEKILSEEISTNKYLKTIKTTGKIKSVQGKNLEEFLNEKHNGVKDISEINSEFVNINIEALDISKKVLNYSTMEGRWLSNKDANKNYIVLGSEFNYLGASVGDKIAFDIQGKTFEFEVIGICAPGNFKDNFGVYIDINTFKDNNFINDNNGKIEYLIKCDIEKEKVLSLNLTKKLKNSLVINQRALFNELGKYISHFAYVFVNICCISVFSALCLIGNILMIINFERLMEFLVLNVVGAKNRHIRIITTIEGLIIGGISGILGCLICEFLSNSIVNSLFASQAFKFQYSFNTKIDLIMTFSAIFFTITCSLLVINNMKIEKYSELLRAD